MQSCVLARGAVAGGRGLWPPKAQKFNRKFQKFCVSVEILQVKMSFEIENSHAPLVLKTLFGMDVHCYKCCLETKISLFSRNQ